MNTAFINMPDALHVHNYALRTPRTHRSGTTLDRVRLL